MDKVETHYKIPREEWDSFFEFLKKKKYFMEDLSSPGEINFQVYQDKEGKNICGQLLHRCFTYPNTLIVYSGTRLEKEIGEFPTFVEFALAKTSRKK